MTSMRVPHDLGTNVLTNSIEKGNGIDIDKVKILDTHIINIYETISRSMGS